MVKEIILADSGVIYDQVKEEWRTIKESPYFMVSNMGRVKSLTREVNAVTPDGIPCKQVKYGKMLSPYKSRNGYLYVEINDASRNFRRHIQVHRLVAEAFIPNPNGLPMVNHKDENGLNNKVDNLEWCNCKYNINYGSRTDRAIAHRKKKVAMCSSDGSILRTFNSITEAAQNIKRTANAIVSNLKGRTHYCDGYKWIYV